MERVFRALLLQVGHGPATCSLCQRWVEGICMFPLSSQGLSQLSSIISEMVGNVQCVVAAKQVFPEHLKNTTEEYKLDRSSVRQHGVFIDSVIPFFSSAFLGTSLLFLKTILGTCPRGFEKSVQGVLSHPAQD